MLYPMIFQPRFVEKMWGGRKLNTILNKALPTDAPIGESWEIYDFPPGVVEGSAGWVSAVLTNGPHKGMTLHELVQKFGVALTGKAQLVGGQQFPLLIKFLDAREDLSVQVHPPTEYVKNHPGAHLKNEMWYVVQSDVGSRILKGLKPGTTRDAFASSIDTGQCEDLMGSIVVKDGDCHYLPSGTVHALGAGILAAEVQTPSDTTYRVFDFNRVDPSSGSLRKLHVEQAMDCIDFGSSLAPQPPCSHVANMHTTVTRIVTAPQFLVEKVRMSEGVEQRMPFTQPVIWMMLEGTAEVSVQALPEPVVITKGQTVLFPAAMDNPTLKTRTDCTWLEVTIP